MLSARNSNHPVVTRRRFLSVSAVAALSLALPRRLAAALKPLKKPVKLGLIADLHQDIMHDGVKRMQAFVDAAAKARPDALVQLGDFAYPNAKNKQVIDLFNSAHNRTLHVIGNHDMDAGHTRRQCYDIWGMPSRYYVDNVAGLNIIVLDGNDKGSPTHKGGYASYIGPEQTNWLKEQLGKLEGPIVVMSHQPLAGAWAIDNAEQIQAILSEAADKILLAVNGHSHIDYLLRAAGVNYLHINSASYQWVGGDYKNKSYAADVHEAYPWIEYTCPYRESLFAMLTIDPQSMKITLEGRASEWVGKSPAQLGKKMHPTLIAGEQVAPRIRDRAIERGRK